MRVGTILAVGLLAGATTAPRCSGVRYSTSQPKGTEASYRELPMVAESNPTAIVPQKTVSTPVPEPAPAPPARDELFFTTVRPILATKCAPCHNPGGRMYARLPFDDPKVLSSHSTGALRRLKGDERATFEKWLATLAPPAAER
jgi:hypothetical protein